MEEEFEEKWAYRSPKKATNCFLVHVQALGLVRRLADVGRLETLLVVLLVLSPSVYQG
jgi:hypothetical protein